jgi:hypothetical protein
MATFDEIVESAKARITELKLVVSSGDARINAIKDFQFIRPLTDAEFKELAAKRNQQLDALDAIEELELLTALRLDQTKEMKGVLARLEAITARLRASTNDLLAIGVAAQNVANTLTKIAGIGEQIKDLLAPPTG